MAGRSVKKKNSTAPLKKAVTLIAVFVVLLFTVLDLTGLVSFDSLLIKAGVEDKPAEHAQTEVHFIDVGQGDSTLVISQGEAMLIDSGDKDDSNKIEKYLDELADEYKVLLYNALVSRTKPLDDLSVSELLRLDNEIKKPLFEDYQKKQHRRQLFLIAGLIYMFTGVFLYFLQKVIWSDFVYNIKSITSLIAVIITFVGFVITIYSCFFQMFYNKNSRYKIKKEDATKILEYEIIAKWRELDGIVNDISMNLEVKTPRSIIQFLVDNRFIDDEEKDVLRRFLKVRNNIVHSMDNNYTEPELKVMLDDIDKIINKIKKIM